MDANIVIQRQGTPEQQEMVEFDGYVFGLGLNVPTVKTQMFPTLSTLIPLLDMQKIREIVESTDFEFGRKQFDSSWITNQNGYGSCAAYAGSSALAKGRVLQGQERVDLSGDYLYSLVNGGRDRGSMLDENMAAIMRNGVCTKETVPLGGIYRRKYNTRKADEEAARFRGHELYACPDEQSLATALAMKIPVVIAIHVTRRWRSFDSDDVLAECNGVGNHSEHLDDIKYDSRRGCFLYRKATSHGRSYSGDGYCWTLWEDHYKVSSRYHQFYAVPGAIQDPQGDNPPNPDGSGPDPGPEPRKNITLTVYSNQNCGWCTKWKNEVLPKVRDAGWTLRANENYTGSVPRFVLDIDGQKVEHVGYWTMGEMEGEIEKRS